MAEILKVVSPITVKDRTGNVPGKMPDAVFNMGGTENAVKSVQQTLSDQAGKTSQEELMFSLAKEIMQPLNDVTTVQSDSMKEMISLLKLMAASGADSEMKLDPAFLEKLFLNPQDLMEALIGRDQGETPFKGEAFDILRMLSKAISAMKGGAAANAGGTPANAAANAAAAASTAAEAASAGQNAGATAKEGAGSAATREAIASVLRHFDGLVNSENSLKAIVAQSKNLMGNLLTADRQILSHHIERLEILMNTSGQVGHSAVIGNIEIAKPAQGQAAAGLFAQAEEAGSQGGRQEVSSFLKNEFLPMLSSLVTRYQQNESVRKPVMSIIHNVTRFDKGDPKLLNQAVDKLADELKSIMNLSDSDFADMKKLIIEAAKNYRAEETQKDSERLFMEKFGISRDESDMSTLLSKSLQKSAPPKAQELAANLLQSIINSESPVMPLMHFMIPVKYENEDTYLEFYIDKNSDERKGEAQSAQTIFFTIQSEKFGTFEVDLLAKDLMLNLDIKCPSQLVEQVSDIKGIIREDIEACGYRLAQYQVSNFVQEKSVLRRFPKLAAKKVGMDVKV
ncbi:MAG: hypothetical protein K6F52_02835 [Clostridia bacterium]|nr:hypothetical protein [Clostridia bacterium]